MNASRLARRAPRRPKMGTYFWPDPKFINLIPQRSGLGSVKFIAIIFQKANVCQAFVLYICIESIDPILNGYASIIILVEDDFSLRHSPSFLMFSIL